MTQNNFEERLAVLEAEMARLRADVEKLREPKDWRSAVGMFTGDKTMKRIDEYGRQYREADRRRTLKALSRKKKSRKS
jgi:uncharacterized small protein (DUF1192 family)